MSEERCCRQLPGQTDASDSRKAQGCEIGTLEQSDVDGVCDLKILYIQSNLGNMNIHTGLMAVLQAVIYIIIPTPTSVGYAYVICHRLDTM